MRCTSPWTLLSLAAALLSGLPACGGEGAAEIVESSTTAAAQAWLQAGPVTPPKGADDPTSVAPGALTTPAYGDPDPLVVVTIWDCYECKLWQRQADLALRLLRAFPSDVQVQHRYLPLRGPRARMAAEAAAAAHRQGRFRAFRRALFGKYQSWTNATPTLGPAEAVDALTKIAEDAGLDMSQFVRDFGKIEARFALPGDPTAEHLELPMQHGAESADVMPDGQTLMAIFDPSAGSVSEGVLATRRALALVGAAPSQVTLINVPDEALRLRVSEDKARGRLLDLEGPAPVLVNGVVVPNARFKSAARLVQGQLAEAGHLLDAGMSRGATREALTKVAMPDFPVAGVLFREEPIASASVQEMARTVRAETQQVDLVWNVPVSEADPMRGAADALVTLVEFSDFQCSYCTRLLPTIRRIEDRFAGQVRLVFKHFPLPFHTEATGAAVAAHCANGQGRFWDYHDLLFARPEAIKARQFNELAEKLDLDLTAFTACMADPASAAKVSDDMELGQEVAVRGTPTIFVNGRPISGARGSRVFARVIQREIEHAKQVAKATGKAGLDLYQELVGKGKPGGPGL